MKKICAALLALAIMASLVACGSGGNDSAPSGAATGSGDAGAGGQDPSESVGALIASYAERALGDMFDTWWDELSDWIYPTRSGYWYPGGGDMPWEAALMMSCVYTYWLMNGRLGMSDDIVSWHSFNREWEFLVQRLGDRMTQNAGLGPPSPAIDDSGWNATYYMMIYDVTKNEDALQAAHDMIVNTIEAFKSAPYGAEDDSRDRSGANGLWYPMRPPSLGFLRAEENMNDNRWKSLYAVGVISVALELLMMAAETDPAWKTTYSRLWEDVFGAYEWIEANLLRATEATVDVAGESGSAATLPRTFADGLQNGGEYTIPATVADNLYWTDYNENRTGAGGYWNELPVEKNGPTGASRGVLYIQEAGSFSFMGGAMAMAVCHARVYALTGDEIYLNRAVRTVWALTDSKLHTRNGILVNDRDAWANGFFAGMYAREALTLPGVRAIDVDVLINTGISAFENCRVVIAPGMDLGKADEAWYNGKAFYRAEWSGGDAWTKNADSNTQPTQIMTCGSTVNMIMAAAYAQRLREEGAIKQ